ncbi:unnamed protein product [Lactuca saligna]|uniref:Uncharacterized protein n=1 Tax=Lactuca saligna TaxID=75948 RepID=A0AA35Y4E5_LACSI|nr:unnamed protein product [Lactuca saligna]
MHLVELSKRLPTKVTKTGYWIEIANGSYTGGTANERKIRKVVDCFIHQLIKFSINEKKERDRIPLVDVFFLCIITPIVFCHLPYCVADFLVERLGKSRDGAPIYGGMLVTKLARSFGVFDEPKAGFLTRKEGRPFQPRLFKITQIVKDMGNDTYSVSVDDTVEIPKGRRNMKVRVKEMNPRDGHVDDKLPMYPYHIMARQYNNDLSRVMNYLGFSIEAMMHHLSITPLDGAPPHYTYTILGGAFGRKEEVQVPMELEMEMMRKKSDYP